MDSTRHFDDTPSVIHAILVARTTTLVARIALTLPYWWSGIDKLFHPHAALDEIHAMGLPSSWVLYVLLLLVQLVGSLAIITNRYTWIGAGALAVFTGIVTYLAHAFWKLEGPARFAEMNDFMEHIALMAGFAFAALHGYHIRERGSLRSH
jgi:transmembrane protein